MVQDAGKDPGFERFQLPGHEPALLPWIGPQPVSGKRRRAAFEGLAQQLRAPRRAGVFECVLCRLDPIRDDRSRQSLLDAGFDQVQPINCCVIADPGAYFGSGRAIHDVQHSQEEGLIRFSQNVGECCGQFVIGQVVCRARCMVQRVGDVYRNAGARRALVEDVGQALNDVFIETFASISP
ncbi:MAG: hypothetical protein WDO56_30530 [Gammaproteobacteria bacterium]